MVHVSKNRKHVSSLFERFVTTSAAFWAILRNPPTALLRLPQCYFPVTLKATGIVFGGRQTLLSQA